jgi:hypothetical protein
MLPCRPVLCVFELSTRLGSRPEAFSIALPCRCCRPEWVSLCEYSGCQINVPIVGRYFVTTTYAAILFFGTLL